MPQSSGSAQLYGYVTFTPRHAQDFNVAIIIQSLNVFKPIQASTDFICNISIINFQKAYEDFPVQVYFRQPPIQYDVPAFVIFAANFQINVTNIDTSANFNCTADNTGYFHVDGLIAGNYLITPVRQNTTFTPSTITVNVEHSNATLYFMALGIPAVQNLNQKISPVGTVILPTGNYGTFTIEGFILPDKSLSDSKFQDVIAIISDEDIATAYRKTLP